MKIGATPVVDESDTSNPTDNESFGAVLARRVSRREVLGGSLAAAVASFIGSGLATASRAGAAPPGAPPGLARKQPRLGFAAVPAQVIDDVAVPPGYTAEILIPWGQPLRGGGPAFVAAGRRSQNTAAEQAEQIGMNHDGMHFFPIRGRSTHGLLVLNHEYVEQRFLFPDGDDGTRGLTVEEVRKSLAAHGVAVVEVKLIGGAWQVVDSPLNRRVTGATPVAFAGPVSADHPLLATGQPPRGTLNNCAHGFTPWGTYLACEENFNGYFGTADSSWVRSGLQARYGVTAGGFGYRWHTADPRFDLAATPAEINRFGWVVEIDPFDPASTPVKRTALGRFKHEGALVTVGRGQRVAVYSGDDENGDYIYKFVSSGNWRSLRARGVSPLDGGVLHVARFHDNGSGEWLPLVHGTGPLTPANGWADQADVLIRTRQAADALGATRMDRPEWIAQDPGTGELYVALTNGAGTFSYPDGSVRPTAVNPRTPNPFGHIVRWKEWGQDHATATAFDWDIFLLAGDPTKDPLVTVPDEARFGSPDGLWIDPDRRVWVQTDISNSVQLQPPSYDRIGNNAMLAADPDSREVRRFLVGPNSCEVTGVITTPDRRTMFVNIQHPGEADRPLASSFPDHDPNLPPRSCTIVIRKTDGGVIGT
jgi:hypothetical protein